MMLGSRLNRLIAAGLVDSFGLAFGWTVFVLYVVEEQGLVAAGVVNGAMLVGIGLSAPAAGWLASLMNGRLLLQSTAIVEAGMRVGTFLLLLLGVPLLVVAFAVMLTSVVAWTGYAGMRAEVAAVAAKSRARALTWYVGGIAAVEAAGAATAAGLPTGPSGTVAGGVLIGVIVLYAACLAPTFLVARSSIVARSRSVVDLSALRRCTPALGGGFAVMLLASGPTFLAVALAYELYGRLWVAPAAMAFAIGALIAPSVVSVLVRRGYPPAYSWPLLGVGLIAGWIAAPWHPAGLLAAQLLSGVFMTALEGVIDARIADDGEETITGLLGWSGATRALGGAAAVFAAPTLIAGAGLGAVSAVAGAALAAAALVGALVYRFGRARTVGGTTAAPGRSAASA